ncbi:unnamed protein product [Closterium sp. NIES-54]
MENVGAGTSTSTSLTPSVPLTKLLGGGGLTTALLLLALTTTGATPLCKAATSSATASAASATSSASATSAASAPSATATASSASTAAADTSTSATTPTTTPTPSTASTTTSAAPASPTSALAPLAPASATAPLGADAAPTDSKPPRSAAAAEATEGKRGEGEHPSKIGDVTFDELVPYYRLFPYRTAPLPPPPLFLVPGPPPVDPLPSQGPAPSGVSQVDAVEPVEVAVDSGAGSGAEGAEPGGAEPGSAEPGGAEPGSAEPGGAEPGGAGSARVASRSASSRREPLSPQELREWFARRWSRAAGAGGTTGTAGTGGAAAATGVGPAGASGAAGAGAAWGVGAGVCPTGGTAGAAGSTGAAGPAGVGAAGATGAGVAGGVSVGGSPDAGPSAGAGVGAVGAGGAAGASAAAGGTGAVPAGSGDPARPRPYFVALLEQVLGLPPSPGPAPSLECPQPFQSQSLLQPVSPLPTPSPYTGPTGGLAERREPASPVRAARTSGRTLRQRPPAVPRTHQMALRPSTASQRVPLPSPPASSLPVLADPESDSLRAASPTVARLLSTVVTDPSFDSVAASALVAELVDFAACCRLDYAAGLVAESASVCPPSVGGECALSTDVLEDRQEEFQCFAAALPHLVSMLIAPEGDPDAPDILTPRSSLRRSRVPTPLSGSQPWTQRWLPGSPQAPTSTRFPHLGRTSQRQGVDYFQTFSPTPKMTFLRVLLHVAAQRDYELHSLDFSTAFLQGSLHEEIWLRRPPGFTGSFPPGTQWSLRRPVYGLRQAPRECHDTLRTTLAALGFAPSTADPSLFLRTDTSLPLFYTLVYLGLQITRDRAQRTITLTQSHMVQQVLQRFDFTYSSPQATPLSTRHSLSALPSDEFVEPSGPYPELVGCLMYLMTCTRPDLAYPLSILARYVAPGRHRPEHMAAAKRVLRYLCSTSGMGLVLRGRHPVVLTGHADASWADEQATQRSSQGYTFSLGSGSVSWRSTRSSSVLGSSCEAEIYAGAMAAQELRWLTYLLTDLGEQPRSPPVLYVDNKAMLALCREHRLEHRTKHIALRYFLARELQQRGQLRLAYVLCLLGLTCTTPTSTTTPPTSTASAAAPAVSSTTLAPLALAVAASPTRGRRSSDLLSTNEVDCSSRSN